MSLSKLALVGTGGKIYLDGILIAYIKTINIKVTGDFEDIESCGSFQTDYAYTGCKCEGTLEITRVNSDINVQILEGFKTGNMPMHTIVTKLTNMNTSSTESYSVEKVVFTEVTPIELKKGVLSQSLPFKCAIPTPLSTISI